MARLDFWIYWCSEAPKRLTAPNERFCRAFVPDSPRCCAVYHIQTELLCRQTILFDTFSLPDTTSQRSRFVIWVSACHVMAVTFIANVCLMSSRTMSVFRGFFAIVSKMFVFIALKALFLLIVFIKFNTNHSPRISAACIRSHNLFCRILGHESMHSEEAICNSN